jgi:putative iron-dependent peroxidase
MLKNMVIGRPPGTYDRLLDFTHAVSGTNFFAPSVEFLAALAAESVDALPVAAAPARVLVRAKTGTLSIGNLKGVAQHEYPAPRARADLGCCVAANQG